MSHFGVLVLAHPKQDAEDAVNQLLAPYDENIRVPMRDEPCYCCGRAAKDEITEQINAEFGNMGVIREKFGAHIAAMSPPPSDEVRQKMWTETVTPVIEAHKTRLAAHPGKDKPQADCDKCEGSGIRQTQYNPKSKWDWFVIGGRWTGCLSSYKPGDDPKNQEHCSLCNGTGKRTDSVGEQLRAENPTFTCNSCDGKGVRTKWATEWERFDGDIMPVRNLKKGELHKIFHAILTPDSNWHQQGEMGWFGFTSEEMTDEQWEKHVLATIEKYGDHTAVVVDCHI